MQLVQRSVSITGNQGFQVSGLSGRFIGRSARASSTRATMLSGVSPLASITVSVWLPATTSGGLPAKQPTTTKDPSVWLVAVVSARVTQ